jgi:hypothetical protein
MGTRQEIDDVSFIRPRRRPDRQPDRSGWRTGVARAAVATVLAALILWCWVNTSDPKREVRTHHRPLVALERVPAPELGEGFERWRMIAAGNDTVTGLWRPGVAGRSPEWVAVILGGIGTDDAAARLVPDSLPVGVLAVSWPWKGPRHMSRAAFLASVPAIRSALLRTPGAVARGAEAVRRAVPGARVVLLGASLGVPPTVAALPLVHPDALVLVDGAADLDRLLASEISHALGGGSAAAVLAPPVAALAGALVSFLEPARYGADAVGVPVMLVDAGHDERYPRACIERLHAAFPHATLATHPGGHLRPEDRDQVTAIIAAVRAWLPRPVEMPASPPAVR